MSMFHRKSSLIRPIWGRGAVGVVPNDERPRGAPVNFGGPLSAEQGPLELRYDAPERRCAAPTAVDRYVREILHFGMT